MASTRLSISVTEGCHKSPTCRNTFLDWLPVLVCPPYKPTVCACSALLCPGIANEAFDSFGSTKPHRSRCLKSMSACADNFNLGEFLMGLSWAVCRGFGRSAWERCQVGSLQTSLRSASGPRMSVLGRVHF